MSTCFVCCGDTDRIRRQLQSCPCCCRRYGGLFPLALLGGHTGAAGAADHYGFGQNIGGGSADVRTGNDHFACFKYHFAGCVAKRNNFSAGFDVVAGVDGGEELHVVIGAEKAFVAVGGTAFPASR